MKRTYNRDHNVADVNTICVKVSVCLKPMRVCINSDELINVTHGWYANARTDDVKSKKKNWNQTNGKRNLNTAFLYSVHSVCAMSEKRSDSGHWINLFQFVSHCLRLHKSSIQSCRFRSHKKLCAALSFVRLFYVSIMCFRLFLHKVITQRAEKQSCKKREDRHKQKFKQLNLLCLSTHTKRAQWDEWGQLNSFYGMDKSKSRFELRHSLNIFSLRANYSFQPKSICVNENKVSDH